MMSFKEFLEQGLASAKQADAAKKEIESVLKELRDQVLEATGGIIKIDIKNHTVDTGSMSEMVKAISNGKPIRYSAIEAESTRNSKTHSELSRWKTSDTGYPCVISFDGKSLDCADKESLISALSEMLSSPSVGRKIQDILTASNPQ